MQSDKKKQLRVVTWNLFNVTSTDIDQTYIEVLADSIAGCIDKSSDDLVIVTLQELMGKNTTASKEEMQEWLIGIGNAVYNLTADKFQTFVTDLQHVGGPPSRQEFIGCVALGAAGIELQSATVAIDTTNIKQQIEGTKPADIDHMKALLESSPLSTVKRMTTRKSTRKKTLETLITELEGLRKEDGWYRKVAVFELKDADSTSITVASCHCPGPEFSKIYSEIPIAYCVAMAGKGVSVFTGDFNTNADLNLTDYSVSGDFYTTLSEKSKYDRIYYRNADWNLSNSGFSWGNQFDDGYVSDHAFVCAVLQEK